jgi:hypothetical protein
VAVLGFRCNALGTKTYDWVVGVDHGVTCAWRAVMPSSDWWRKYVL